MFQKNCILKFLSILLISMFFIGCGGGGGGSSSSSLSKGVFIDDVVEGIHYVNGDIEGYTNSNGEFSYEKGIVEFYIGSIKIGEISSLPNDKNVFIQDVLGIDRTNTSDSNLINIATFLQSLDSDDTTDKIEIKKSDFNKFKSISKNIKDVNISDVLTEKGFTKKTEDEVKSHLSKVVSKYLFDKKEKDFLYNLLKKDYLWSEYINDIDYSKFRTPNEMIDNMKYNYLDKWSYAESFDSYESRSSQITSGFGCKVIDKIIVNVLVGSPCEISGLKRGDNLIKINSEYVTYENYSKANNNTGVEVTFEIVRDIKNILIKITPKEFEYKVSKNKIFESPDGKKVGLFIYDSFSARSTEEIDLAFKNFKENAIDDLVIDLRYNGGGSLDVASYLLDYLAGNNESQLQYSLESNEYIEERYFERYENSLELSRIYFLTSERTASASEVIINALKPYMDVKVIGEKTHGKPVGMFGRIGNGNYIYWLISFSMYNSLGDGGYFDGLAVNCLSYDDRTKSRQDMSENLLNTALNYIEFGQCKESNDLVNVEYKSINDNDNDGILNDKDSDDDNDGVNDEDDFYPLDESCYLESDGDGETCYYRFIENIYYSHNSLTFVNEVNNKIIQYDHVSNKFLNEIDITGIIVGSDYSIKDNKLYIAYESNEVKSIDLNTMSEQLLIRNTNGIADIKEVGKYILIEDNINTWADKHVYDKTGNLLSSGDRSYKSKLSSWDNVNNRYYFLSNGISPSDLYYHEINQVNGEISRNNETPYHGAYEHSGPIIISKDGTNILLGTGDIYKASDLTWQSRISEKFEDGIWTELNELIYLNTKNKNTTLFRRDANLKLQETLTFEGTFVKILKKSSNKYIIITKKNKLMFNEYTPSNDTDKDGVINTDDAFPFDPSASIDNDGDSFPDEWNIGFSEEDSTTGLKIDYYPEVFDCNLIEHGDGIICNIDNAITEFNPSIVLKDDNDIIYLLSNENKRIYRWNNEDKYKGSIGLNKIVSVMTYSSSHQRLYLGYESGLITYIDLTGKLLKEKELITLAKSVEGITTVGEYLLSQDKSGGWNTHYIINKQGTITDKKDLNYYSKYYRWDDLNKKVYFFRDGTTPNDLHYEMIDQSTGKIIESGESPYHGDYIIKGPISISKDGNSILLGSGDIYNSSDLTWQRKINDQIESAVWTSSNQLIYAYTNNQKTTLKRNDSNNDLIETISYDGALVRIVEYSSDKYIVITKTNKLIFNEYTIE